MKNYYLDTPIFYSNKLKSQFGLNVYYKMDCYQPSGSFKIRGMSYFLKEIEKQGSKKVVASSGGNAGYSLAYVAKQMGISVKLIVPKTTSDYMINKIKMLDADIDIVGETWDEANNYAIQLSDKFNLPYIPPFDHPYLWTGHSSIIDECVERMPEPDKIVVAVGGGGLLCGIFQGLLRNGWLKAKIITAETEGAASFSKSFEAGHLIELDEIKTIATSLGAKKVTKKILEYIPQFKIEPYIIDDESAFYACKEFFNEFHSMIEPACGAALSYVINNYKASQPEENILIIVCGGVNMGIDKFLEYSDKFK